MDDFNDKRLILSIVLLKYLIVFTAKISIWVGTRKSSLWWKFLSISLCSNTSIISEEMYIIIAGFGEQIKYDLLILRSFSIIHNASVTIFDISDATKN